MMYDFFFGYGAILVWSLMTAAFVFLSSYLWLIVLEIGGIRGTAMATMFGGMAVNTGGFALLLSESPLINPKLVGVLVTTAWWPMLLSAIILADLYAADRNSHRSFTTRSYQWFIRVTRRGKEHDKQFTA